MERTDFEWDDLKAAANYRKHGVAFEMAKLVFSDRFAIEDEDWNEESCETRYEIIGMAINRLLFVAYTMRGERVRIISAREAEPYEKRRYHEEDS
jgi:uncharacterized DUF497 family protein